MIKVAEAIEKMFGRLKPHVVEKESLEKKREYYQNLVANGIHFNEKPNCTFEDLIDKDELTKTEIGEWLWVFVVGRYICANLFRLYAICLFCAPTVLFEGVTMLRVLSLFLANDIKMDRQVR